MQTACLKDINGFGKRIVCIPPEMDNFVSELQYKPEKRPPCIKYHNRYYYCYYHCASSPAIPATEVQPSSEMQPPLSVLPRYHADSLRFLAATEPLYDQRRERETIPLSRLHLPAARQPQSRRPAALRHPQHRRRPPALQPCLALPDGKLQPANRL